MAAFAVLAKFGTATGRFQDLPIQPERPTMPVARPSYRPVGRKVSFDRIGRENVMAPGN